MKKKTRAELLQEAMLLEQMGAEWDVDHVAAFARVSVSYVYKSQCPRVHKRTEGQVSGKGRVAFIPKAVRAWNDARTEVAA